MRNACANAVLCGVAPHVTPAKALTSSLPITRSVPAKTIIRTASAGEREIQTELTTMMPKGDIIAEIMKLNPTADPGFLSEFSNGELSDYLDRLANARGVATYADVLHKTHPDPMLPDRAAVQSSTFSINAPGISYP